MGVFVPVGVVEFFGSLFDVFVLVWDVGDFGCVGGLHGGAVPFVWWFCWGFIVAFLVVFSGGFAGWDGRIGVYL